MRAIRDTGTLMIFLVGMAPLMAGMIFLFGVEPMLGIEPGTKWDDSPDDWVCPDCGVGKEDFEMVEI